MATKIYEHPFSYGETNIMPLDFHTFSVRRRLPGWRQCQDPKAPFVTFGADSWNCSKCEGEKEFSLLVNSDDTFQFQFQFDDEINEDPSNPIYGWQDSATGLDPYYMNARILDCNCETLGLDYIDEFAIDYGVSFDAVGGSFQWLKLDVSLIPVEVCCFYLQIEHYNAITNDQNIVAGPFRRNDVEGCNCNPTIDETILVCGSYKKADCWGRRYDVEFGENAAVFSDCVRLVGSITRLGTGTDFTYDGEVLVKSLQRTRYRVDFAGMPPMIAEWLSNILASNGTLTIGDYTIDRANGDTVGAFDKAIDSVQMFHGSVEFSIVCGIENFGCN